jgi:hypothetical protein
LEHDQDIAFKRTDIAPLLTVAWNASFTDATHAKKALAQRGWNPLNKALLLDKEALKSRNELEVSAVTVSTDAAIGDVSVEVNVNGVGASILDQLVAKQDKEAQRKRNIEKKHRKNDINHSHDTAKKLMSGVVAATGDHALGPEVLQQVKVNAEDKKTKADLADFKRNTIQVKLHQAAKKVRAKKQKDWNDGHCGRLLQHKKQKGDPAMAKTFEGKKLQYDEQKDRPSPAKPSNMPEIAELENTSTDLDSDEVSADEEDKVSED